MSSQKKRDARVLITGVARDRAGCSLVLEKGDSAQPDSPVEQSERTPRGQPELSAVAGVLCRVPTSSTETPGRHESQFERAA